MSKALSLLTIFCIFSYFYLAHASTTILFLGDSLTEGYGVDQDYSYPSQLREKLLRNKYQDFKIINAGISGSTSASGKSRLKWYLQAKIDILFLALGGNDGLRGISTESMKKNLDSTIELAKQNEITVVLAGIFVPPNYGLKYSEEFAKVFYDLQKKHGLIFLPFLLEGVAANPKLNIADGLHPNSKGYQIVTETVFATLKPLLDKCCLK